MQLARDSECGGNFSFSTLQQFHVPIEEKNEEQDQRWMLDGGGVEDLEYRK